MARGGDWILPCKKLQMLCADNLTPTGRDAMLSRVASSGRKVSKQLHAPRRNESNAGHACARSAYEQACGG